MATMQYLSPELATTFLAMQALRTSSFSLFASKCWEAPARDRFGRPQRRSLADDQPEEAVKAVVQSSRYYVFFHQCNRKHLQSQSLEVQWPSVVFVMSVDFRPAFSTDGHLECWDVCHGGRMLSLSLMHCLTRALRKLLY